MLNKVLCLLFLVNIDNFCLSDELPEVETPLGKIRGLWSNSIGGRKYAEFVGIPYAKPPVGELRFEEPQPVEPWVGVLEATQPRICLQTSFFNNDKIEGEEDCLYLNVFVPTEKIDPAKSFDVLAIIHGGAFSLGSGHTLIDSKILLDRDLIVVTFNYRLGVLGFLSTEDASIPGNNGMKDQVLALKWIQENIASFGGNPDSVTIAGLSAGGASVHLHYFSPLSQGLFVRGLSQSGTALNSWAIQKNPLQNARKLGTILGCPNVYYTDQLKKCFKTKLGILFLEAAKEFSFDKESASVPFGPVIEKGTANPFLTKNPYVLLREGNVQDLPWITSVTADDGLIGSGPHYTRLEKTDQKWSEIAHYLLDYNHTLSEYKRRQVAKKIKDFYLGPGEHINKENFKKFTQIFTDRFFAVAAETAAKLQARVNKSPVYYYVFNYQKATNKLLKLYIKDTNTEELDGVAHGDDGLYFYTSLFFQTMSESDIALRNACQDILYSYATTGKPSIDGTDDWQPTEDTELTYLNITGPENMRLQRTEYLSPTEFWRTLGLEENENLLFKDEL